MDLTREMLHRPPPVLSKSKPGLGGTGGMPRLSKLKHTCRYVVNNNVNVISSRVLREHKTQGSPFQ